MQIQLSRSLLESSTKMAAPCFRLRRKYLYSFLVLAPTVSAVLMLLTSSITAPSPALPLVAYDDLQCGCPRWYTAISGSPSLCGEGATARGRQQRVVAYSIFGKFDNEVNYKKYWGQIEDRVREVDKLYPGWIMRLYHNISAEDRSPAHKHLCLMYCQYSNFDPCYISDIYPLEQSLSPKPSIEVAKNTDASLGETTNPGEQRHNDIRTTSDLFPDRDVQSFLRLSKYIRGSQKSEGSPIPVSTDSFFSGDEALRILQNLLNPTPDPNVPRSYAKRMNPTMWRFLPMADPSVSEFLVRDIDSSILPREVAAVNQWLNETTGIAHVMRDHPSHNGAILAGMWGGSHARGAGLLKDLFEKMVQWPPRAIWDYDQRLLQRVVWPEIKDSVVIHDSYYCQNKHFLAHHRSLPFPTRRQGTDFVSWGILRDHERAGIVPCPRACRPPQHRDWVYC